VPTKAYTLLGWAVWQFASRKFVQNKVKLGAAATVAAVLVGGLVAGRLASSNDD